MNRTTIMTSAITVSALAFHSDTILYWIGPAGCVILIPALVIILLMPLIGQGTPALSGNATAADDGYVAPVLESSCTRTYTPVLRTGAPCPRLTAANFRRGLLTKAKYHGEDAQPSNGTWSTPVQGVLMDKIDRSQRLELTETRKPDGTLTRSIIIEEQRP